MTSRSLSKSSSQTSGLGETLAGRAHPALCPSPAADRSLRSSGETQFPCHINQYGVGWGGTDFNGFKGKLFCSGAALGDCDPSPFPLAVGWDVALAMGWGLGGGGNGDRGGRGAHLDDERVPQHAEPDQPQPLVLRARARLGQGHGGPPPGPRSAARHGATGPGGSGRSRSWSGCRGEVSAVPVPGLFRLYRCRHRSRALCTAPVPAAVPVAVPGLSARPGSGAVSAVLMPIPIPGSLHGPVPGLSRRCRCRCRCRGGSPTELAVRAAASVSRQQAVRRSNGSGWGRFRWRNG